MTAMFGLLSLVALLSLFVDEMFRMPFGSILACWSPRPITLYGPVRRETILDYHWKNVQSVDDAISWRPSTNI